MDDDLETSLEGSQDEYEGNKDAARALMRVKQKLDGYEDGEMRSMHGQMEDMESLQLCVCLHEKNMTVSCYLFPEEFLLPKGGGGGNKNSKESLESSSSGAPIPTASLDDLPMSLAFLPPAYLFPASPSADLIPLPSPSPWRSFLSSYVTIGSTIYRLGGLSDKPICDVFAYTANSSSKHDWIRLPSMSVGRVRPVTAVLDHKLYVFGSNWHMAAYPHKSVWAEVFDTISQQWSPLPELDSLGVKASSPTLALAWHEKNSIVVLDGRKGRNGSLFLYNPELHLWTFLDFIADGVILDFDCHGGLVLVNGWIYYSIYNYIYAYNIIRGFGIRTIINGFPTVEYMKDARLIHLGGEHFCMLCLALDCLEHPYQSIIHYVRFHVSISTEGEMTSHVMFCELYYVAEQYYFAEQYPKFLAAFLLRNPRRDLLSRVYASEEERVCAFKRAEKIQSKLGPKSFIIPVLQSHVTRGFWLSLPLEFCKTHLPHKDEVISLVDENGKEFSTKYLAGKTGLSGGWRGFAIDHQLVVGDALVFHLVRPTEFEVSIVRATMKWRSQMMSHYELEQAESSL